MKKFTKDMRRRAVALTFVSAIIFILIYLIVYTKVNFDTGIECPIKHGFNIECPGCGGTRMVESLLKLQLYQAFRFNPFLFITVPFLIILYLRESYLFITMGEFSHWIDKVLISYTLAFIFFGFLRNLDLFFWLTPTLINMSP